MLLFVDRCVLRAYHVKPITNEQGFLDKNALVKEKSDKFFFAHRQIRLDQNLSRKTSSCVTGITGPMVFSPKDPRPFFFL